MDSRKASLMSLAVGVVSFLGLLSAVGMFEWLVGFSCGLPIPWSSNSSFLFFRQKNPKKKTQLRGQFSCSVVDNHKDSFSASHVVSAHPKWTRPAHSVNLWTIFSFSDTKLRQPNFLIDIQKVSTRWHQGCAWRRCQEQRCVTNAWEKSLGIPSTTSSVGTCSWR